MGVLNDRVGSREPVDHVVDGGTDLVGAVLGALLAVQRHIAVEAMGIAIRDEIVFQGWIHHLVPGVVPIAPGLERLTQVVDVLGYEMACIATGQEGHVAILHEGASRARAPRPVGRWSRSAVGRRPG